MKVSELISILKERQERFGDIEVVMRATTLPSGFTSLEDGVIPDVFESTVENAIGYKSSVGDEETKLMMVWQR